LQGRGRKKEEENNNSKDFFKKGGKKKKRGKKDITDYNEILTSNLLLLELFLVL